MTSTPSIRRGGRLWPGIVSILLFLGFLVAILQPRGDAGIGEIFGRGVGFPEGESVIANIGYAMLHLHGDAGGIEVESFLVALILIAVLLDAALGGAVLLASRDDEGGEA